MTHPTARALELLTLLENHRYWPGAELAERLGVTTRTLRRDIERLRELGYGIAATQGPSGGYHLESGGALPPLLLEDDEAIAIAVGLRSTAAGALTGAEEVALRVLAKLDQMMPPRLRHRVTALHGATLTPPPWEQVLVDPELLSRLAVAAHDHERIRFGYRSASGVETRRHVEPHTLVSTERRWYLVSWDLDRRDWRTFRVDRVSDLARTHDRFTPRALTREEAEERVVVAHSDEPQPLQAWVHIDCSLGQLQQDFGPWAQGAEATGEATCRWPIGGRTLPEITGALLWMERDYWIDGPAEFVAHLAEFGARMTRAATRSPRS